jgi:hypothetical protein
LNVRPIQTSILCDYRDKDELLIRFQNWLSIHEKTTCKFYKVEGANNVNSFDLDKTAENIKNKLKDKKFDENIYIYFKSLNKSPLELKASKLNVNIGEPVELMLENVSGGGNFKWGDTQTKSNSFTYYPIKSEVFLASYQKDAACKIDSVYKELKVVECPCAMSVKWDYLMDKKISDFDPNSEVYGLYPDKTTNKYYILCNNTCGVDYINVELTYADDDINKQTKKLSWKYKYVDVIKSQETITSPIFNSYPDAIAIPISPNKLIDWDDDKGYGFIYKLKISLVLYNDSINYCNGEPVGGNEYKVRFSYCPF